MPEYQPDFGMCIWTRAKWMNKRLVVRVGGVMAIDVVMVGGNASGSVVEVLDVVAVWLGVVGIQSLWWWSGNVRDVITVSKNIVRMNTTI